MTVRELIERLQALPMDAPVLLADWNEDYRSPGQLTDIELGPVRRDDIPPGPNQGPTYWPLAVVLTVREVQ